MDTNSLIKEIAPLYNQYKQQSRTVSGTKALEIMWDVGDILKAFIQKNNIAPHKLFWQVYGNSETSENITQNSYITREFQNRCHRIRNIFDKKSYIKRELPNLKKFTLFREAMPFFDNKKYQLEGIEKQKLLMLLNSNNSNKCIADSIKNLQAEKIGIKNPRTQRIGDLEKQKQIFIKLYNSVYYLLQEKEICSILKEKELDIQCLKLLAQNTNSLSQKGLKFINFSCCEKSKDVVWNDYIKVLNDFSSHKTAVVHNRFRRVVPVAKIVKLADMLYLLTKNIHN